MNVSVAWRRIGGPATACGGDAGGSGAQCVVQSTLIPNPSGGLGPNVKDTHHYAQPDTTFQNPDIILENDTETLSRFRITLGAGADTVNWIMDDGGSNGQATARTGDATGTLWDFSWTYGDQSKTSDGTYTATIQAFLLNSGGNAFPHQISLNRYIPNAPNIQVSPTNWGVNKRLYDGTSSGHAVEIQWNKTRSATSSATRSSGRPRCCHR